MMAKCYLPAEWHRQEQILITFPHKKTEWGKNLTSIASEYANIIKQISSFEKITVLCFDEEHLLEIKALLNQTEINSDNVYFVVIPTNDVWIRDYGPITLFDVTNIRRIHLAYRFNAWGVKYSAELDDNVIQKLVEANCLGAKDTTDKINFVLEGGSLEVNDKGHLLTTSSCLLHPKRNPDWSAEKIEQMLRRQFGLIDFTWIDHAYLAGDDTDGHIDMIARFTETDAIVYTSCNDKLDPQYLHSQALQKELAFKLSRYTLVPLPIPQAIYSENGKRLPASYANFLIINDAILVPAYGDKAADDYAREILADCFPKRKAISVSCRHLIEQFGSLHCATMQIPELR